MMEGGNKSIEKESNDAIEDFSHIVDDETMRIQQVADSENERTMQKMRANGTIRICPICLEELLPIRVPVNDVGAKVMVMLCCGASHCHKCSKKSKEFMFGTFGCDPTNAKCYSCREPMHSAIFWDKAIKPNDTRHWLLSNQAHCYINGTDGIKKDTKKAIQLFKRAAELGGRNAQIELTKLYYTGHVVPKCLQKARYYAEKAVDHGSREAQFILAQMIENSDSNSEEEVFRLYTLAAFQGCKHGRMNLGIYYQSRWAEARGDGEGIRKNALLAIYWFGKAAEVEVKTPEQGCQSLVIMAIILNAVMQVWHPRSNFIDDPLPGYSHIPFVTWALAKGVRCKDRFPTGPFDNAWKRKCASCGCREKKQLKTCSRCKAFYYCSKKCQMEHWKAGHKVDCKGHWIEKFFPAIRKTQD